MFDIDVKINISSALMELNTLGVGVDGFALQDNSTWADFLGVNADKLESAQNYVFLSVKLVFDLPDNSFKVKSMENTKDRLGWLLSVRAEEIANE